MGTGTTEIPFTITPSGSATAFPERGIYSLIEYKCPVGNSRRFTEDIGADPIPPFAGMSDTIVVMVMESSRTFLQFEARFGVLKEVVFLARVRNNKVASPRLCCFSCLRYFLVMEYSS